MEQLASSVSTWAHTSAGIVSATIRAPCVPAPVPGPQNLFPHGQHIAVYNTVFLWRLGNFVGAAPVGHTVFYGAL